MTTPGDESRRRPVWQPPDFEAVVNHTVTIDPQTWALAQAGAAQHNYTVSSYLRMALYNYLNHPRKIVPPGQVVGGRDTPRTNIRTTPSMWERIKARAARDRTNLSAVVSAAIVFQATLDEQLQEKADDTPKGARL